MSCLASCGAPFSSVSKEFENECWLMQDTLELSFENKDTAQVYSMWFPIVFNDDYAFNNIHLRATVQPPSGETSLLPARFSLVSPTGDWLTEKDGAEIPFDLLVGEGMRFNQVGKYRIRLYHYMRDSSLCGIERAGIMLDVNTASAQ